MIPDSYYKYVFSNLDRITHNKWMNIPLDRQDRESLIEAIKMRIVMYDDFIFSDDYMRFKRITPYKDDLDVKNLGIVTEVCFLSEDEVPTYDITKYNLPILIKPADGKRR